MSREVEKSPKRLGDELYVEALETRLLLSAAQEIVGVIGGIDLASDRLGFDQDTSSYFAPGPLDTPGAGAQTLSFTPATADPSYMLIDDWGGAWHDAEKSPSNTEDDLMCWAAAASNILAWTGWGRVSGMTTTDQMFSYFQDHWTDQGGLAQFGWGWWFNGINATDGWSGWSQVDVAGGGFHPGEDFDDYLHWSSNDDQAIATIDTYLHAGYGVTLGVYGPGGHAITCWGYTHTSGDPTGYTGIYVSDSDDSKWMEGAPDRLRYYDVDYSGGRWYLQDFYGSDSWYVGLVEGLEANPGVAPGNQAPTISGLPDVTLAENTQRDNAIDLWTYAADSETADSDLLFTITNVTESAVGVSIDSNRWLDVTPFPGWFGTGTVTVRVSDGELTSTDAFDIVVTEEVVPATPQGLPYVQDFSSTRPGFAGGWEYYSTEQGRIEVAGGALRMDDSESGSKYSLNEAILHMDLAGASRVTLTFDHTKSGDESHPMASIFTSHANADGVAMSADGVSWYKLTDLTASFTARTIDLDAAVSAAGLDYTSDLMIKFQQYDNYSWGTDGRSFDNIAVETGSAPAGQTIATWTHGAATVTALDMNGGLDASPGDFRVSFGSGGVVTAIQLRGSASLDGVALVITGAARVNQITDARTNTVADLSFIAADCDIRNITLKGNLAGFDLNGLTIADMTFAADVDGDGNTSDLTGVYSAGAIRNFTTTGGNVQGDLVASGDVTNVMVKTSRGQGGSLSGELRSGGSVNTIKTDRGVAASASIVAAGRINTVIAGTSIGGSGHVITAGTTIGKIQAKAGDAHSAITAAGSGTAIGQIQARRGDVKGAIVASNGSVGSIKAQRAGGVGGAVGANINAAGNIARVQADAAVGGAGVSITAGGAIGMVKANGGDVNAFITCGAIRQVQAKGGDIKGWVIATNGAIGNVKAQYGARLGAGGNISSALSATGNISSIQAIGQKNNASSGNITGTISSTNGKIGSVKAQNGDLASTASITAVRGDIGNVQADAIGTGGDGLRIDAGGRIGSLSARRGGINGTVIAHSAKNNAVGSVRATGGNIAGSITAAAGGVTSVQAVGGSVTADIAGHTRVGNVQAVSGSITGHIASASGRVGDVLARNGNITGDITAATRVGNVKAVNGSIMGLDITAGERVGTIQTAGSGDISNLHVRAANRLAGIRSARDIAASMFCAVKVGSVKAGRNVASCLFAAGYDFGPDNAVGAGDTLVSGTLGSFNIVGNLTDTVITAGVGAGADSTFGTDDDVGADGAGKLGTVRVKGVISAAGAGFAIQADRGNFTVSDSANTLRAGGTPQVFPGTDLLVQVR